MIKRLNNTCHCLPTSSVRALKPEREIRIDPHVCQNNLFSPMAQWSLWDAKDISRMLAKAEKTRGRRGWPLPTALKPHVRGAYSAYSKFKTCTILKSKNIFKYLDLRLYLIIPGYLLLRLTFPSLLGYSKFTATEWWTYAAKRQKSPKRYSLREAQVDNGSNRSAANNQSLACTREYSDCTGCRVWTGPHGARCAAVWFSNGGTLPQNSGLCAAMLQQRSDSAPECLCWTFLNLN